MPDARLALASWDFPAETGPRLGQRGEDSPVELGSLAQRHRWAMLPFALAIGAGCGWDLVHGNLRLLLAMLLLLTGALAVLAWPMATVGGMLAWLPILGLVRRLLIPVGGWSSYDPLLLFAPAVVVLFCVEHPVFARPWNTVTRWAVIVTLACSVEAVSPMGAGLRANMVGALFIVVPLLWFFVGRVVPEMTAESIIRVVPFAGLPLLAYSGVQVFFGLPIWDQAWVNLAGYAALSLGHFIRPFGTFASGAENEIFLLFIAALSFGLALRTRGVGRWVYAVLCPVYWAGAFLDGSRTGMVAEVLALGILWTYSGRRFRLLRVLMTVGLAAGGYIYLLHHTQSALTLTTPGSLTGQIVSHQVQGLAHPFNTQDSTAPLHAQMLFSGFISGFHHPLGEGLGIITLAGTRFGGGAASSEVDLSNLFIAGGVVGGLGYLGLAWLVARGALRAASEGGLPAYVLPALLVVAGGQWLNGGYYFIAPLVWMMCGHVLGRTVEIRLVAGSVES